MSWPYQKLVSFYYYVFNDLTDSRTQNWFLIKSPLPILALTVAYLLFVNKVGPAMMKNRPPMKLKNIIVAYNIFQVVANAWIFYESGKAGWFTTYSWKCQNTDFRNNEEALAMAKVIHAFFLLKLFDYLDTIFFVLRKKNNQASFLHIYHHSGMVVTAWCVCKYYPGGHGSFAMLPNSLVHVIMYAYYTIAALGVKDQRVIKWKQYLTTLQLIQFGVILIHSMQLLVFDCGFPKWPVYVLLPPGSVIIYLFIDFYAKSYIEIKSYNGEGNRNTKKIN